MENKFDWDDILIEPAVETSISSRSTIETVYNKTNLPLIAAPMDTVVSEANLHVFLENKINVCLPRGSSLPKEYLDDPRVWFSVSLQEFELLIDMDPNDVPSHILIDIANGHIIDLVNAIKSARKKFDGYVNKYMTIMAGNIAHPDTYYRLSDAGADYVRVGIGNGNGCFVDGTNIKTLNGNKNIEDIEIGDQVLTHTGEYKEVINTIIKESKKLVNVNETLSTPDHEYYVLHKRYLESVTDDNIHKYAEWLEADKLTRDFFLLELVE